MNIGCSNAQLVSVLNSEDPGTLNIFNGASYFPDTIARAVFDGGLTNDAWKVMKQKIQPVGTNAQFGVEECYKACGIEGRNVPDIAEFDDAAQIWDEKTGRRDGYFDAANGRTKPQS